ncbi:MAG: SDR family NAD(P)-dependent oxidoreductase [Collinsella sp.]
MLLEGKAIITGGTRGIGYAIACPLSRRAPPSRSLARVRRLPTPPLKSWRSLSQAKVWGRSCDLTSLEAVTEAFTQAAADMGGLDTVVNNAGISQRSPLLDYTAEEFAKVMDLNVVAVFNGHQAAAKIMTEAGHGGTITTTSSMVAKYGQPSGVGYPTSKFAVNGMVQSLSRELAPMGIRVNAVAPGVTKTDMVANLPEEVIKPIIATIPLGRMGEPEDVANAFVFLASDMSSYVTGAILPVDGAARS